MGEPYTKDLFLISSNSRLNISEFVPGITSLNKSVTLDKDVIYVTGSSSKGPLLVAVKDNSVIWHIFYDPINTRAISGQPLIIDENYIVCCTHSNDINDTQGTVTKIRRVDHHVFVEDRINLCGVRYLKGNKLQLDSIVLSSNVTLDDIKFFENDSITYISNNGTLQRVNKNDIVEINNETKYLKEIKRGSIITDKDVDSLNYYGNHVSTQMLYEQSTDRIYFGTGRCNSGPVNDKLDDNSKYDVIFDTIGAATQAYLGDECTLCVLNDTKSSVLDKLREQSVYGERHNRMSFTDSVVCVSLKTFKIEYAVRVVPRDYSDDLIDSSICTIHLIRDYRKKVVVTTNSGLICFIDETEIKPNVEFDGVNLDEKRVSYSLCKYIGGRILDDDVKVVSISDDSKLNIESDNNIVVGDDGQILKSRFIYDMYTNKLLNSVPSSLKVTRLPPTKKEVFYNTLYKGKKNDVTVLQTWHRYEKTYYTKVKVTSPLYTISKIFTYFSANEFVPVKEKGVANSNLSIVKFDIIDDKSYDLTLVLSNTTIVVNMSI